MEDTDRRWKEIDQSVANEDTWADRVFGSVCPKCGKRPYTFAASRGAEDGKNSVCTCNEKTN